ncbi:MAG: probable transposase [Leptospirillum rubarum]|nr:MAG: probable transposase [Leptospirillum rubarum]
MRKPAFQRCLRSMKHLTSAQRHELKIVIEQVDNKNLVEEVASLVGIPTCCPHCRLPCIRPWGNASGLPRYRCQSCKRTFGPLTNTPLAGLHHKDRWLLYLEGFAWGESVRKAARRCGINKKASFNWRHRFLALPSGLKARQENGIVEADESWFLRSYKGQRHDLPRKPRKRGGHASKRGLSSEQVPVLVVRDRSGATSDAILPKDDHVAIEAVLTPLLARDAVLCTDGGGRGPFALAAREMGMAHRAVNLRKGIRVLAGVYHIQNVNGYHSRLKGWMQRFHGVATSYLGHYLGWRRMLERFGDHLNSALWLTLALGRDGMQQGSGT